MQRPSSVLSAGLRRLTSTFAEPLKLGLSPNLQADLALNFAYRDQMDEFELRAYKVLERDPAVGKLHNYLIASLAFAENGAPPSSQRTTDARVTTKRLHPGI